jgi:hypothetical protein
MTSTPDSSSNSVPNSQNTHVLLTAQACVLARLLARQAAAEFRVSQGDENAPTDEGAEDHGKK